MITREHVLEVVTHNIVDTLEDIDAASIDPEQSMKDLGANSLDIVEIVSCSMRELKVKVPRSELSELQNRLKESPEKREAQQRLAGLLCDLLHSPQETKRAQRASQALFRGDLGELDKKTLLDIFSDVPSTTVSKDKLSAGLPLVDLLVSCKIAQSKGAARRLLDGGGLYVNNTRVSDTSASVTGDQFIDGSVLVLRSGKKNYYLVQLA